MGNKVKNVMIVSLSSGTLGESFVKHELDIGVKRLEKLGLSVRFSKNALMGRKYLGEHPEKRAEDLLEAFRDPEVDLILCAIGGYDTYRLLPYLFGNDELKNAVEEGKDKLFLGFSDTTCNHLMLHKLGLATFYGQAFLPDVCELDKEMLPYTEKYFRELIETGRIHRITPSGVWYEERHDFSEKAVGTPRVRHENGGFVLLQGSPVFSGKILGGCVESLADLLIGMDHPDEPAVCAEYGLFPPLEDWRGKILLLESSELQVPPEEYRRALEALKATGIFSVISGILVGKPMDEMYMEEYHRLLVEVIDDPELPILANISVGHATPRCIVPFGAEAAVDAEKQEIRFCYGMPEHEIVRLSSHPEMKESMARWFNEKWSVPLEAYLESMDECLEGKGPYPEWYCAMEGERIIGGLGVIENDFHNRPDLAPNVCAVYTEPNRRCLGVAGELLERVCADMKARGVDTLYLLTDHEGFYERYGWEYLCPVQGDGEDEPSRMYIHREAIMTEQHAKETVADVAAQMISKPIETERLLLRRYTEADFADYYEYACEGELCRLCGMDAPGNEEEAHSWFRLEELAEDRRFAIVYKPEHKVIGFFTVGIYPFVKEDPALAKLRGISISLGISEKYQRRGLMKELLREALRCFFTEYGLDFVNSGYFVFNEGSRRLQEGAGMKHYMDHVFERGGVRIETREMIIYRDDFLKGAEL